MSLEKDIIKMIKTASASQASATDTTATVVRTDGNTAWVHFDGGVPETPVEMTISCKAGDTVRVRVADGNAYLVGNGTAPPTDDSTAIVARTVAVSAQSKANTAQEDANKAAEAASSAQASADSAATAASNAQTSADNAALAAGNAQTSANNAASAASAAQTSADSAGEYASRALGNLASVQSVSETLTWITAHGTMTLTADAALDPSHVYFVVDAAGDYTVGGVRYSIVTEPKLADIGTYYELSIDESLNNYVSTHLALDSEGLWVIPDTTNDFKVLIATGSGGTYTTAGTYIVDGSGYTVAQFTATEMSLQSSGVELAHFGYDSGNDGQGGTATAPYASIGQRKSGSTIGNYSTAEGYDTTASGRASHAEGYRTTASGNYAHAEGANTTASGGYSHAENFYTTASGDYAHAEGVNTTASGFYSHAEGSDTIASAYFSHAGGLSTTAGSAAQTAIGKYNDNQGDTYFEVGNGTSDNARSNAFEVTKTGYIRTGAGAGDHAFGDTDITVATSDWVSASYTAGSGAVYAYKYEYTVTGMTSDAWADICISSGSFSGNFAVETGTDTLTIRTSSQPSASMTFRVVYQLIK